MNLKKWLQPKYIIENLKKSKSLLALILFLFPLITSLVQLSPTPTGVVNILNNSTIVVFGMFIVPVLLSISFFSFVYKKKKVDFMIGMPLSRRQIFFSNTLSGIAIIIIMFLINIGLLYLFTCFNPNIILNTTLLFDYFVIYTLGYILVFTMTNVAMSLAGNLITQIVLTILLLFLMPFCIMFQQHSINANPRLVELSCQSKQCQEIIYEQCVEYTGVENCKQQAASGYYYTELNKDFSSVYSVPVEAFIKTFSVEPYVKYHAGMLLQTFFLSLFMIVIGLFTFQRRKMEECETSFTNFYVHTLVKCLTLIPLALLTVALQLSLKELVIALLLLVAYYYLYDLITQKGIQHSFKSLFFFVITIILCFSYYYGTEAYLQAKQRKGLNYIKEELQSSDITGFHISSINPSDINLFVGYQTKDILFQGKDQINTLLQYAFQSNEMSENKYSIGFKLHVKQGFNYTGRINISEEQYQRFTKSLSKSKEIQALRNIKEHDILMMSFLNISYSKSKIQPILPKIKKLISTPIMSGNYNEALNLTIYKDHDILTVLLPITSDREVLNYMLKLNNENIKQILKKEQVRHISVDSEELYTHDRKTTQEISDFIEKQSTVVDSSKSYIKISLFTTDNKMYHYITNQREIMNYFSKEEKQVE